GRRVGVADPQRDDVDPSGALLGDLPLELGEQVRRQLGDTCREPHHIPRSVERNGSENVPAWICSTGPVSFTCRSAPTSIRSVPPSRRTVTGDDALPSTTAATAAAIEPEPDERVSPAPRSHTRIRI